MSDVLTVQQVRARPGPPYDALRSELLTLIEQFSSDQWTDYNTHDPGITLGEHLCFGVTEANYVASLPMADLLTPAANVPPSPSPLFPANAVLPCRPLTLPDYRKLVIDQDGVRNAWVEETPYAGPKLYLDRAHRTLTLTPTADTEEIHPRGFLLVLVDFDGEPAPEESAAILAAVRRLLEAQRNLCEVFTRVEAVPIEEVSICVDLDVAEDAELEKVAAQAFFALEQFLSPVIRFYSLEERLAKGLSPEAIFNGPLLQHGFIDDDELAQAQRPDSVRTSDLVNLLMDVPGITAVRRLVMTSYRDGAVAVSGEPWILPLDPDRAPGLSLERSRLLFYKRELPFLVASHEVEVRLQELRAAEAGSQRAAPAAPTLPVPAGRRRRIDEFQTLLNLFALNYGVGQAGLPLDSPAERLAQARQFKAFVLLCEQLLAGHRGQVARLPELLGLWRRTPVLLARAPANLRDFSDLAEEKNQRLDEQHFAQAAQPLVEPEAHRLQRRLRIIDHLLARFAEPFQPYAVISAGRAKNPAPEKFLADKLRLLKALPGLAHDRAAATNLLADAAVLTNISGLERKLRVLLGAGRSLGALGEVVKETSSGRWLFQIKNSSSQVILVSTQPTLTETGARAELALATQHGGQTDRYVKGQTSAGKFTYELVDDANESIARAPSDFDTEAERDAAIAAAVALFVALPPDFTCYVLEHVLLLPRPGSSELLPVCDRDETGAECAACDDPYSFRITVVLPFWPAPLRNIYLREHLERIIREQAPAHIFVKICWVDEAQMNSFGAAWIAWRRDLNAEISASIEAELGRAQALAAQERVGQAGSDAERAQAEAALAAAKAALDQRLQQLNQAQAALAQTQDALIRVWLGLRSVFPVATLHDCVDGNDDNPVVLDKALLGTFQEETHP